jgi:hypothetical protein
MRFESTAASCLLTARLGRTTAGERDRYAARNMIQIVVEYGLLIVAALFTPLGFILAGWGLWRRQGKQVALGLGCLLLSSLLWWRTGHAEFWIVDDCLDAGGRYDHQTQVCEFE